jgi:hypothetical protein
LRLRRWLQEQSRHPLKPADWQLTFDGKTVSFHPSIGNWNFPCRSHYWIRNNRAGWDEDWS